MTETNKNLKIYEQPIFINLFLLISISILFVFKLIFSIVTNSLALQADAFDNLTDIVMYFTAIIGISFTNKKPNEKFPYGYYKIENIISLIISIFIFLTAFFIIIQSFSDISDFVAGNQKTTNLSPIVFSFLIISLIFSIMIVIYLKLVYKKTMSPVIESEANEKLFDVFISSSVIIGFIGLTFNFYILDVLVGLVIVLFIIKGGYTIFITSTKTLLDAVITFDNRTELYKLVEDTLYVRKIENMSLRSYGRYIFLELEVSLVKSFPITQINTFSNNLKNEIKGKFPSIFKIIIIAESQDTNITTIAVPLENNEGIKSNISKHFGKCSFFALLKFEDFSFREIEIFSNKFEFEEKRKGILVSNWLISKKVDKIYLKEPLNEGPSLLFKNNLTEVIFFDLESLTQIINIESKKK